MRREGGCASASAPQAWRAFAHVLLQMEVGVGFRRRQDTGEEVVVLLG